MVGKSSWDNMLRRTKTLFRTSWDFDCHGRRGCIKRLPNGGLSKLMRMLRKLKRTSPNSGRYSVTLMGHSMGSIVASDAASHGERTRGLVVPSRRRSVVLSES